MAFGKLTHVRNGSNIEERVTGTIALLSILMTRNDHGLQSKMFSERCGWIYGLQNI
jgi:hypothetical protein